MAPIGGGDGANKLPERWVDDEGYERDQDGNLVPDPFEGWLANEALDRGGRGASMDFWRRIANNERDAEIDVFIWLVANRLVEADRSKGDARRRAIVKAVGLEGQGHVDAVLHTQKRESTKARDDRITQLISLQLPEREIWRKLAEEGLVKRAPDGGHRERVPPSLRKAIFQARKAQEARDREMIRGFEDLSQED